MTLSELRFIVALAHEKNFRKAAEKSFVSQPALSLGIKKIEQELNLSLFERSVGAGGNVRITPIGQKIIDQAAIVLEEAAKIKDLSANGDKQLNLPFKLGLIYSIAPYLLPMIIPNLRKHTPNMPLEIHENITKNLENDLKQGAIDAAVIALPFDIPGVSTEILYDEPFVVIAPLQHSWDAKKNIKAKDLAQEKVLLLDRTHCFSNQVKEACPGLSKNSEIQIGNSLETIRSMVASNLGISVLPKSATSDEHNNPQVKIICFESPVPFRRVALAYRKSAVKKEAINAIVGVIKSLDLSKLYI
ncbi:hydrogen peroxide-inducible genes activator [Methylophilaceae bacterium]|jgi:LysR family hydrogen peroxide-inducible transcriptional activator|nr:hydrogen peroxide-inducible genes activator [Methylophilaceae bacterium]|tara:strand:- start:3934 stop:4839 length:906 start_codon:yes stop_codon:yes gene_type:complete